MNMIKRDNFLARKDLVLLSYHMQLFKIPLGGSYLNQDETIDYISSYDANKVKNRLWNIGGYIFYSKKKGCIYIFIYI